MLERQQLAGGGARLRQRGRISNDYDYSHSASVAIAPDGTPYVAWHDYSGGNCEIYVRRWLE